MPTDPADEIAAALARLRGRRPRPPFPPEAHHHPHGGREGHGGRGGPWGRGAPPWADPAHGRFGGPARLRMLDALVAASGSLSVGEIAEAVGVDPPRASRLVHESVELGLGSREADPADALRTLVRRNPAGQGSMIGFSAATVRRAASLWRF